MIITKQKNIKDILESLKDKKKVFIIGCGECATVANTGGEKEVKLMADELENQGKEVVATSIPDSPCFELQISRLIRENKDKITKSDALLIMACGLGVQNFKKLLEDKSVLPGCDTLCIGTVSKNGRDFFQYCSSCGNCVLDTTDAYCPITRCPKGMLNGPCGGVHDGKCEVDRSKDCVWVLIHKSLSKDKNTKKLKEFKSPRDYSINTNPQYYSSK